MEIKQVRHATLIISYAGTRFLIDPMLASKDTYPGFEGTANSHLRNPTVELPYPVENIVDVDAVIVTHTHPDHWDEAAKALVPKELPLFVQHETDANLIRAEGFKDVRILETSTVFNGVSLTKTSGQHGSDEAMTVAGGFLGEVSGVVFQNSREKTLYLAGDTIWNDHVKNVLASSTPDVVILNSGDAQVTGIGSITMGKQDVYQVHQAAPHATLIATHMEAVNHTMLSRRELREFAAEVGIGSRVVALNDGEVFVC